jgi:hypothetical protein
MGFHLGRFPFALPLANPVILFQAMLDFQLLAQPIQL